MERNVKYLIIGAGISGLTFANYADGDYLIVEKEDEVGGYCRTIKEKDYVWDYAGHFFHFSTDEFKKRFIDSVDEDEIIYKDKNTKIIYKGELVDYPFQTNIHQLEKSEFIDCLYDLFHKEEKEEYDNFLDMLYGKFGKSIVEKFLKPYNEKLYAVDLTTLDKDAMGRFFPYADIPAIIDNMKANKDSTSYNNSFLYPRSGAGSFIQILYDALDKEKVLLNHVVDKIDRANKKVILNDGSEISYEYLINTSPLNRFLTLFDEEKMHELQSRLSYNKVLVFNLLDADKLSMYIEIGYSKDAVVTQGMIDEQLRLTLENLLKLGIIDEETKLEAHSTILMDPAYVHINSETDAQITELKKNLADENIYTIGRYGAWTYCSMEDSMIAAKNLAEKLKDN